MAMHVLLLTMIMRDHNCLEEGEKCYCCCQGVVVSEFTESGRILEIIVECREFNISYVLADFVA